MDTDTETQAPRYTNQNRKRLKTLKRRQDYLEALMYPSGGANDYDRAELAALKWAIEALEDWMAA